MIERILLKKLRERLSEIISLYESVYDRWHVKCRESVEKGDLSLYGYSKLLEDMQKRIVDSLLLVERLAKLEKETSQLDNIDEAVRALAYYIMELSEEERKEVFDFIKKLKEKRKLLV
jgi:DNA mismatch repair ATPase MutS